MRAGRKLFNIEYLAKKADVSRRTVRYYIQRGLLPPPLGQKRGSYYTEAHLERLLLILKLSAKGVPLLRIKTVLESDAQFEENIPELEIVRMRCEKIEICDGIDLFAKSGLLRDQDIINIKKYIISLIQGEEDNDGKAYGAVFYRTAASSLDKDKCLKYN
ncbi:MAG: MerR family transcriptional regulator [Victivallaceae bacterium]